MTIGKFVKNLGIVVFVAALAGVASAQTCNGNCGVNGNASVNTVVSNLPGPPSIDSGTPPGAQLGVFYSFQFHASGGQTPFQWSSTGNLPTGLTLNATTGLLSGTPTSIATFASVVTVTDANSNSASQNISITVSFNPTPPSLNCGTPSTGQVGTAFSYSCSASGGTQPYGWSETGTLPTGVTLNSATGLFSGTPLNAGSFPIVVKVCDFNLLCAMQSVTFTINAAPPPVITSAAPPNGNSGVFYSFTFTDTCSSPPCLWSSTGVLPTGLSLNAVTGVFSGTPTTPGTYTFIITVTDVRLLAASKTYTVIISAAPLTITNSTPLGGVVGLGYSFTFTASGGTPGYMFSLTGTIPPGFMLNMTSGVLSGVPTTAGSYNISLKVSDTTGNSVTALYTIQITGQSVGMPILPQLWVNPHACDPPGGVYDVTEQLGFGSNTHPATQAGLNAAIADWIAAGDLWYHVQVLAGATLTGNTQISIPSKAGATKCLVIESSTPLPSGQTVCSHGTGSTSTRNPGCTNDIASMWTLDWNPTLFSSNPALIFQPGSNHVVIRDAEIRLNFGNNNGTTGSVQSSLVIVGAGSINSATSLPAYVGLDRIYLHGCDGGEVGCSTTGNNILTGIQLNCTNCWLTNSYTEKVHQWNGESHLLSLVNSTGPEMVVNNWLESGSAGMFSGGQTPSLSPYSVPSDVEVRRNRFTLDPNWLTLTGWLCSPSCGRLWGVKNRLEMKLGQRYIYDGNIIEYSWKDAQTGPLVLFTNRACSGGVSCTGNEGAVIQDITFTNNVIRHGEEGMQNDARSDNAGNGQGVSLPQQRTLIANNLMYDVVNFGNWGANAQAANQQAFASGTSGNQFACTGARNGAGTTSTLSCTGYTSSANGTWNGLLQMFAGDPLLITNCSDSSFNTPTPLSLAVTATAVTQAAGGTTATVSYANTGTASATATGCQLSNRLGWHNYQTVSHNGFYFGNQMRIVQMLTPSLSRNVTYTDNMALSADAVNSSTSGWLCFGPTLQEGTKSEQCWDTTTFQFHHNVINRQAALYTEYPSGIVGNGTGHTNGYLATIPCSGNLSTLDATCAGFSGFLNGATYPPANFNTNTFDYHLFAPCTAVGVPAGCGGPSAYATAASDGTAIGPNIPAIDAAQALNVYTCQYNCGTGAFPLTGKVIFASPSGSDSNPGTAGLPIASLDKARTLIAGTAGSLALFSSGLYPSTQTAFSSGDSGTTLLPITYRGTGVVDPFNYLGVPAFTFTTAALSNNNGSACPNGTAGCNASFAALSTTAGNTNAQTQVVDPVPTAVSSLPISNYLYAGANVPVDCYYQDWFLNSGGHNGHINIGMDESNPANIAAQAAALVARGCTDVNIDSYGNLDGAQAYNLSVQNAWATYLAANPSVPLKLAIMIDQGALLSSCPTATNDQTTCLTNALEALFDYIDTHYGSQPFYVLDSSGRPLVWYFITQATWHTCANFGPPCTNFVTIYTAVHSYAQSHYPGRVYQILDENPQSFTEAGVDGAYGWVQPPPFSNGVPNSQRGWDDSTGGSSCIWSTGLCSGTSYTQTLYNACKANPTKHCVGLLFKGFDDGNASWGTNRVIQQGCGQLPGLLAAKINANFSPATPLERVGLVTVNDYEEGTETETGIDNCARPTLSITNSILTYAVNPTDATYYSNSTVDHLTILYGPNDGSGNLYVAADNIAPTTTALSLQAIIPPGTWNVYEYMTGKALILNRLAGPVSYSNGLAVQSGGQAILSGGIALTPANGFTWTLNGGGITCGGTCSEYDLTVPFTTLGSQQPTSLFYNGQRRYWPSSPYQNPNGSGSYFFQASPDGVNLVTFANSSSPFFPIQGNAPSGKFECYGCYSRDAADSSPTSFHAVTGSCTAPGTSTGVQWALIMAFERWTGALMRLCPSISDGTNTFTMSASHYPTTGLTTAAPPNFGPFAGQRYIRLNALEDLAHPQQWYADPCVVHTDCSTGIEANLKLIYLAALGENPNTGQIVVGVKNTIMTASSLQNVQFNQLTISHDAYTVPAGGQPGISDASNIPAANSFQNSNGVSFFNVAFSHMQHWAFEEFGSTALRTSTTLSLTNCSAFDLGTGGFRIGKTESSGDTNTNVAQFVSIKNCQAAGMQRLLPGGTGIGFWWGNTHDDQGANLTCYDAYNGCYGVGASQGFAGTGHIFANNIVLTGLVAHDIGQGVTSDMGAIHWHSGSGTGNVLNGFDFRDITQDPTKNSFWSGYNGLGLYVDNSSSNIAISNGQVIRASQASVLVNSAVDGLGQNNSISNVILAYGRQGCLMKSSDTSVFQIAYSHLVCYGDKWNSMNGPQYEGGSQWITPARWSIDNNNYFNPVQSLTTGTPWYVSVSNVRNYKTFPQWQALGTGQDTHSTNSVNPNFCAPSFLAGDAYNFCGAVPAGFTPFNVGQYGAQGLPLLPSVPQAFTLQLLDKTTDF